MTGAGRRLCMGAASSVGAGGHNADGPPRCPLPLPGTPAVDPSVPCCKAAHGPLEGTGGVQTHMEIPQIISTHRDEAGNYSALLGYNEGIYR